MSKPVIGTLENAQAGELVRYVDGYGRDRSVRKIDSVTKTRIRIGPSEFNRDTGARRGDDGWCRATIYPFIDLGDFKEAVQMDRHRRHSGRLNNSTLFSKLSLDQLDRIIAIIDEPKAAT